MGKGQNVENHFVESIFKVDQNVESDNNHQLDQNVENQNVEKNIESQKLSKKTFLMP